MMDFTIALPPGWVRIPLDGRENGRAAALATAKTGELPGPQRHAARQRLTRFIQQALTQAYLAGGTDILLSLADHDGMPVAGSCLVSYAEGDGRPVSLDQLAGELGRKDGVAIVQVAGNPAVRHRYVDDLMTRIDYHTRVPGRAGLITFAFSAPSGPLADAMSGLFDAIAQTLRWQP